MIGIFGALWGLMEITLGTILKGLRIPMGGAMLTALACIIFLTGRYFIPKRGSVLMMGAIAAFLKIFSVGTVIAGPFMAILIEATIAEVLLLLFGTNRLSYIITASSLTLYTVVHPFISQGIIFGDNIYKIYFESFRRFSELFDIGLNYLGLIIAGYVLVHLAIGITAGWVAYSIATRTKDELSHSVYYGDQTK
jgi:hypothetical protein